MTAKNLKAFSLSLDKVKYRNWTEFNIIAISFSYLWCARFYWIDPKRKKNLTPTPPHWGTPDTELYLPQHFDKEQHLLRRFWYLFKDRWLVPEDCSCKWVCICDNQGWDDSWEFQRLHSLTEYICINYQQVLYYVISFLGSFPQVKSVSILLFI